MSIEITINKHFAEQTFIEFNRVRFGLESCKIDKDHLYMQDLLEIWTVAQELEDCEEELDTCNGCSLNTIEETIKTL